MSLKSSDVMRQSPLDAVEPAPAALVQIEPLGGKRPAWEPSRYNLRTTSEDGSYIVWNSLSGSISVFKPEQKQAVRALLKDGHRGELKGLAKYLSERGLLVPAGTNEYRQIQLGFGQTHYRQDVLELILLASEDCNFRCGYCYEEFSRGTMKPEVREGVKRMVESKAGRLRHLRIGWFGGEPLYGFQAIEDLAPFFIELAEKHSLNYSSHMTTNGYLLTPDVAEKLLAWEVRQFQITIDGMAEQHDRKRPARDGRGTFETIFSNLRALKARDDEFSVRIRVNYDQENHPHLEEFLALVRQEFGGDPRFAVAFHGVGRWGGANDAALPVCGSDEMMVVRKRLQKSALDKGLTLKGTLRDMNSFGKNVCYAARPYNFVIGADGKVMKCTVVLDKQDHNIVGQLTPDGDMHMRAPNLALWVEPAFESDAGCRKCSLLPTCQGISCPLIRIESNRRPCGATPKASVRHELLTTLETASMKSTEIRVSARD
ncbi:MAG: radical SAM protein [Pyrinomonadaceae bacterium]